MHDIDKIHRRTFICNLVLCILVCFFSIFKKYIAMFDLLSRPYLTLDKPEAILTGGIFQILFGMAVIVLGYLAWANYRTLNIILAAWYALVTIFGVSRLDYLSALIGIVGLVFYIFSIHELRHESTLAQMEGYPEFHEKFDISKSDIVIQTLLAHQGERRTKSTLFTTDYSLRRKKKKKTEFGYEEPEEKDKAEEAGNALVESLQKHLNEVRSAEESAKAAEAPAEAPQAEAEMTELIPEPETEKPAPAAKPENITPERTEAEAAAAAILAEAEARSQQIIAEAEAKAKALAEGKSAQQNQTPQNPNRKKKKHR